MFLIIARSEKGICCLQPQLFQSGLQRNFYEVSPSRFCPHLSLSLSLPDNAVRFLTAPRHALHGIPTYLPNLGCFQHSALLLIMG
jgi:hypothetical protein